MKIPSGPFAYESKRKPRPLTDEEEAKLVFAAAGMTGPVLADLAYGPRDGGCIMAGFSGRTVASGDGIQTVALSVINDQGTWFVKRPSDFSADERARFVELSNTGNFREIYAKSRVKLNDGRVMPPKEPLFNINANARSAGAAGTTYFLPINDLTFMYVNGLLEIFNRATGAYALDERANFQPAGLRKFSRSRGGHLEDNPSRGRIVTIRVIEQFVTEFIAIEQGMMLQNLGLMAQALGLGGFPNFANHEFGWLQALGFTMQPMRLSTYLGTNLLVRLALKLRGQDLAIPLVQGLERNGEQLLRPYAPPAYESMRAAVDAVVKLKYGAQGILTKPAANTAWKEPEQFARSIPPVDDAAVEATVAYCEYVWNRYGRFPVYLPAYKSILGFQACHLDPDFYARFYRPESLGPTQQEDFGRAP